MYVSQKDNTFMVSYVEPENVEGGKRVDLRTVFNKVNQNLTKN
jgi:hypothetical protein